MASSMSASTHPGLAVDDACARSDIGGRKLLASCSAADVGHDLHAQRPRRRHAPADAADASRLRMLAQHDHRREAASPACAACVLAERLASLRIGRRVDRPSSQAACATRVGNVVQCCPRCRGSAARCRCRQARALSTLTPSRSSASKRRAVDRRCVGREEQIASGVPPVGSSPKFARSISRRPSRSRHDTLKPSSLGSPNVPPRVDRRRATARRARDAREQSR